MTSSDFASSLGFHTEAPLWSLHFSWSTIELTDWVVRRKRLKPIDLKLALSVTEKSWSATLSRHDEKFFVVWSNSGIRVDSAELRYRRLTPWPAISGPRDAPNLVRRLGETLGVSFLPHVHLDGTLADEALSGNFHDALLREWISPSASDWSVFGLKPAIGPDGA